MTNFYKDFVITDYFWKLMKDKVFFVYFPGSNCILREGDYEEWLTQNSLTSPVIRFIFRHVKDKNGNTGYCIHCTSYVTDLMIPDEVISKHENPCRVESLLKEVGVHYNG